MEDRTEVRIPTVGLTETASQTYLNNSFSEGKPTSGEVGFLV